MTDRPDDPPAETPMQRALRMRKAAQAAKPRAAEAGAPRPASGIAPGASKPWRKR